jgi:hypothetical protein
MRSYVEGIVAYIPAHNLEAYLFQLASKYVSPGTQQDLQMALGLGQSESIQHSTDSMDHNNLETNQCPTIVNTKFTSKLQ